MRIAITHEEQGSSVVLTGQPSSSSLRCAASITSGGTGRCSQARIRNNPPAIVPIASIAMTIQNAVDIRRLSPVRQEKRRQ
ncbi:hypothetical protein MSMEI_3303 [Mycolicibacterium smegmatis MC2 155]|uniref:Uncharacterized protein n=1 Tax=Mycolicibacterium smegmatis (strain ATCC 700084 / mc(2)155) TaxID=246196 RepID=I7G9B7_MYCS2|nr:hypothetical protein MSMEI_3303 [Mycolicibacterium smegmatis MC2 155]